MLLLKLGSDLQNLVNKWQSTMKLLTKYKLHFHEVECTEDAQHEHHLWLCPCLFSSDKLLKGKVLPLKYFQEFKLLWDVKWKGNIQTDFNVYMFFASALTTLNFGGKKMKSSRRDVFLQNTLPRNAITVKKVLSTVP